MEERLGMNRSPWPEEEAEEEREEEAEEEREREDLEEARGRLVAEEGALEEEALEEEAASCLRCHRGMLLPVGRSGAVRSTDARSACSDCAE